MKPTYFHLALLGTLLLALSPASAESADIKAVLPTIPEARFVITDYGAVGDGKTMNTSAIRAAFEACAKVGGGHVVVPKGDFLSGPLDLTAHTDLHLSKDATLRMTQDKSAYALPNRGTANFIYARQVNDVQISGEGTIDGQGKPWWERVWELRDHPEQAKLEPRRPQMIVFERCERVRMAGIKTLNPPNTHCSIRQCRDVTIEGLTMLAPGDAPNTDAINISVTNCIIRDCNIATGDDNIVLAASAPAPGGGPGAENVLISNIKFGTGHGLSIGSFTGGGIRHVVAENISFEGTTSGIRMKADRDRGGLVEDISFKHVVMSKVRDPIFLSSYYPKTPKHPADDKPAPVSDKTPRWRNITIEDGTIRDCENSIRIWGSPEQPFEGVTIRHFAVNAKYGARVFNGRNIRFEDVTMKVGDDPELLTFQAEAQGLKAMPLPPAGNKAKPAPTPRHQGAVQGAKTITVAADGSGDCRTVQEAFAAVPDHRAKERTVIHVRPGTYAGQKILAASKTNVSLEGEDLEKTILTFDINTNEEQPAGVDLGYKGTGVVILADGFRAEKITFQNTSGDHGQALALRIDGDRAVIKNCRLLGWQDTLMVNKGRQYFKDCFIEGRVDFIYGDGTTVFEHCEIRSKNGGYVTAASTPADKPFGFVFFNCKLTGDPAPWIDPNAATPPKQRKDVQAYLGRPWRPYASVAFLNCEMGDHIKPEGWHNWGKSENEQTVRYAEYHSTGPGATLEKRVPWSKRLTEEEADKITVATVLGGKDNWQPEPLAKSEVSAFHPGKVHIVLCGDSTVTDNAGWGKGFANSLASTVECINLAKGGRSSGSFIKEGSWRKALDLKPDYVLIQFGHNDQPGHGERESDPETTYRQHMTQYVDEARAAGIKPVLVTSLSRREWKDGKIVSRLQPWVDAVKAIAREKNVPVIDLHSLSIERYEELGPEKVAELSPLKNADPTSPNSDTTAISKTAVDGTHLNEKGGALFGKIVAEELKKAVPELATPSR